MSPAGSAGGRAPLALGHLGNTGSRSSSFGNPGHPSGVAQPWLPSPAFPPATGCRKLFWMELCSSLAPSDGNLSRTRGRHRVTGILHWHLSLALFAVSCKIPSLVPHGPPNTGVPKAMTQACLGYQHLNAGGGATKTQVSPRFTWICIP